MESKERKEFFNGKISIENKMLNKYAEYKVKQGENVSLQIIDFVFNEFDAFMLSGATESAIECKVRDVESSKIDFWKGPILEFDKFSSIDEKFKKDNIDYDSFYYFNFFSDEMRIYKIPLDPYMFTWQPKFLQKNGYENIKVWKQVTFLDRTHLVETIKINKL